MSVPTAAVSALELLKRGARGLSWYVNSVMGDNAWQTYRDHYLETHGEEPPMTEREFWRDRDDEQDRNPQSRCC
jgi:uncharacterized short protein YbdD (DUF466 family)